MTIFHILRDIDQLLDEDGRFELAEENDPGLAGAEDNQAAWYGPETSPLSVVTVTEHSIVVDLYDADGDRRTTSARPRTQPQAAELTAAWIMGREEI